MGRYRDRRSGRRLDDLRSPYGAGMVFPPSWSTGEHPDFWDDRPDEEPPDDYGAVDVELDEAA